LFCRKKGYHEVILDSHYEFYGEDGEYGTPGGNGGKAGCGGVSGYGGQSVIIAYQNRMNENKKSSSTKYQSPHGIRGKPGSGGRKGATGMVRKGIRIQLSEVSDGVNLALLLVPSAFVASLFAKAATMKIKTTYNYFFTNPSNTTIISLQIHPTLMLPQASNP